MNTGKVDHAFLVGMQCLIVIHASIKKHVRAVMLDIILYLPYLLIPARLVEPQTVMLVQGVVAVRDVHLIFIFFMMAYHPIANNVTVPALVVEPIVIVVIKAISLRMNLAINNIHIVNNVKVPVLPVLMILSVELALLVST